MFSSRTGSSHPSGRVHFCRCSSPLAWCAGGGKSAASHPRRLRHHGAAAAGIPYAPSRHRRGMTQGSPTSISFCSSVSLPTGSADPSAKSKRWENRTGHEGLPLQAISSPGMAMGPAEPALQLQRSAGSS